MNKREARRTACKLASKLLDQAIASGVGYVYALDANEEYPYSPSEAKRIEAELEEIAQRLFERGKFRPTDVPEEKS